MTNTYPNILDQDHRLPANQLASQQPVDRMEDLVQAYAPVGLQEIGTLALLNRMDTKFLLSYAQLANVLHDLRRDYHILTIGERRIHNYWTLYYDTQGFELYHAHVTGRAHIYKVRSREYLDSHQSFLEIKHKDPKRRTDKKRLPIENSCEYLDGECCQFLREYLPCPAGELKPRLWNTFRRMTLVSCSAGERLTIDLELSFFNPQRSMSLSGIAIAELKQEVFQRNSAFLALLRHLGLRQTGFSKYCFGVAQLYSTVKNNTQKKKSLMIHKLGQGGQVYVCNA